MMGQFMRPLDARHSEPQPSTPNRPRPRSTRLAGSGTTLMAKTPGAPSPLKGSEGKGEGRKLLLPPETLIRLTSPENPPGPTSMSTRPPPPPLPPPLPPKLPPSPP